MEISAMTTRSFLAAATLSLLAGTALAQGFTNPRPMQRATDEYLALLMSRAYDKMDRASDEARTKGTRLTDGQPLLPAIYAGVAGCPCGNQLNDDLWQVRRARLDEWLKHNPASVTARISKAAYPVKYGWFARGSGYSNTVSPEAWKLYRERVEEGRRLLEALDAPLREDAGWYDIMLDVALAQGWPHAQFDALFEKAVAKYPDYMPFHFSRAQFYMPRWYGSAEDQRRVVEDSVKRTRAAYGETFYARLNWSAQSNTMFRDGQADWSRMKAGFERIVADHPDPWNTNNFAKFACMAGDKTLLRQMLPKLGSPIFAAWNNDAGYYNRCVVFGMS
jgi:hypothetical protein